MQGTGLRDYVEEPWEKYITGRKVALVAELVL